MSLDNATWELEDAMREEFPFFFTIEDNSDGVIPRKMGM